MAASKTFSMKLLFSVLLISSFAIMIRMATAGDPDILSDYIVPPNVTVVDGNFFTFTGMRSLFGAGPPTAFKASKASMGKRERMPVKAWGGACNQPSFQQ
jgi:hypothetical protein